MPTYKVVKKFVDRDLGTAFKPGDIYPSESVPYKRIVELKSHPDRDYQTFIEEVEQEKTEYSEPKEQVVEESEEVQAEINEDPTE